MYTYVVEESDFDDSKSSKKNSFREEDPLLELKVTLDEKLIRASIKEEFRKSQFSTNVFRGIIFAALYPFYVLLILRFFS